MLAGDHSKNNQLQSQILQILESDAYGGAEFWLEIER